MSLYQVLFLDIDGTTVQPDHTIEESTKKAVQEAKAQNIEVFLATGRPIHEIQEIADELNIDSYIGYNGAYATYKKDVILNEPMDPNTIEHFIQVANEHKHDIVFYTREGNYFTSMDTPDVQSFMETFLLRQNHPLTLKIKDSVLGLTLINVNENNIPLYKIGSDLQFSPVNVPGIGSNYDVIRQSVNKGHAVKKVLEKLNISKEQAIAFGDGMNDKEMLQSVGASFAMGNANPELLKYAKDQTTSVMDSGIYNGLKKLGLFNGKSM